MGSVKQEIYGTSHPTQQTNQVAPSSIGGELVSMVQPRLPLPDPTWNKQIDILASHKVISLLGPLQDIEEIFLLV